MSAQITTDNPLLITNPQLVFRGPTPKRSPVWSPKHSKIRIYGKRPGFRFRWGLGHEWDSTLPSPFGKPRAFRVPLFDCTSFAECLGLDRGERWGVQRSAAAAFLLERRSPDPSACTFAPLRASPSQRSTCQRSPLRSVENQGAHPARSAAIKELLLLVGLPEVDRPSAYPPGRGV